MNDFKLGIERISEYLDLFKGKRVGLITNPTGASQDFTSSIAILNKYTNLVALFSPEHGIRGNISAGDKLDTYIDPETKITVYSLYGETREPSKEALDTIDVLCFDIQDIGARFYTYMYTMALAQKASQKHNLKFVVFDRPNPLGDKVEGNLLKKEFRSFVGDYPILERHGLTIGELAVLFNKEFQINADLVVIPMSNYLRSRTFKELGYHWVLPSPNIPSFEYCYYFLTTCYIEGTNLSEGRGTTQPFKVFGAPWLKSDELIVLLKEANLPGIAYRKTYFTPFYSKHSGVMCAGIELYITDFNAYLPVKTGLTIIYYLKKIHSEFAFLKPHEGSTNQWINLLVGDDYLMTNKYSLEEIYQKIDRVQEEYLKTIRKYYLYG